MKPINPEKLLNNAVAFHEAGNRCYRNEPSIISPKTGEVFLGAPCIVCYAFSIELYLKLASYLLLGKYDMREHKLGVLFRNLPKDIREKIEDHYEIIHPRMVWSVEQELAEASDAFVDWRYIHEKMSVEADPENLARIGTALHRTCRNLAPDLISTFESGSFA